MLVNLLVLTALDYAFYRRWRKQLTPEEFPDLTAIARDSGLPPSLIGSLGEFTVDRARRDLTKLERAHPGRARIGAFGDSFVYGDEVDAGHEYPAHLRRLLGERAEVINFGNPCYGLGQTALLWERFGRELGLDYLLLGPSYFLPERDQRFARSEAGLGYLHGRWILDGDEARFVDLPAEPDARARFDDYYAFWPRWRYLRYDAQPPGFLAALVPDGRSLWNPFYYRRRDPGDEHRKLVRAHLRRMAASGSQVLWIQFDAELAKLAAGLPGVAAAHLEVPDHTLYRAPDGHLSEAGYLLVAEAHAALLDGGDAPAVHPLVLTPSRFAPLSSSASPPPTWWPIELDLGDRRVAELRSLWRRPVEPTPRALFALLPDGESLADAVLAPLDRPLAPGTPIELELTTTGGTRSIPLGPAEQIAPGVPITALSTRVVKRRLEAVGFEPHLWLDESALAVPASEIRGARVLAAGVAIYDSHPTEVRRLRAPGRSQWSFVTVPSADLVGLPESGSIVVRAGGQRIAVGRFSRGTQALEVVAPIARPLSRRRSAPPE